MRQVISLARYWNKVLASPVRNQTLMFSDVDMAGHRERLAAFASVAERWFGQVRSLALSLSRSLSLSLALCLSLSLDLYIYIYIHTCTHNII